MAWKGTWWQQSLENIKRMFAGTAAVTPRYEQTTATSPGVKREMGYYRTKEKALQTKIPTAPDPRFPRLPSQAMEQRASGRGLSATPGGDITERMLGIKPMNLKMGYPPGITLAVPTGPLAFLQRIQNKRAAASIQKTAEMFGKSPEVVQKMVASRMLGQSVSSIVQGISIASIAKTIGFGVILPVASADVLFQWYALDNIITGQKFFMKDVLEALQEGNIDSASAMEAVEESIKVREIAINKVKLSTSINPLLWAFRKLILAGVEGDQAAIDLIIKQIKAVEKPGEDKWTKLRDEQRAYEEETRKYFADVRKQELADEKEAREYYMKLEEMKQAADKEEREYYARLQEQAKQDELENRKYWEWVREQRRLEEEERRRYWEELRKQMEEEAKSTLGFGLFR